MKLKYILCLLKKHKCTSNLCDISTQIFKRLVEMGLGENVTLDHFLLDLWSDEYIYILALQFKLQKSTLFWNVNQTCI